MLQRSLAQNARDVLPPAAEDEPEVRHRKAAEMKRFRVPESLPRVGRKKLRAEAQEALEGLMRSEPVVRHADRPTRGAIETFWSSRTALVEVSRDELVELAERVPNIVDIYPNRQLRVPRVVEPKRLPANVTDNKVSAWGVRAVGALAVWGAFGARGAGVNVGVLDTGVDDSHPDLAGKVARWAEFDANGQEVAGSAPHDTDRHGTHVCGTIAGGDASGQFIGVAPEANLSVALVLDGQIGGTDAQVLAGLDWALGTAEVDVLNMSLGGLLLGSEVPSTYSEAILTYVRAGVPVVTAIGNEGSQTSGSPGNDLLAFAVGATDAEDRVAGFSGGRTQIILTSTFIPPDFLPLPYSKPEVSAPGVAVYSSVPGGEWAHFNGTSMATPHVAGGIALLLSATRIQQDVDRADRAFLIQDLITGSVEELGESGQDHRFGFGRLDVLRAIGFAREQGL
jgi:subtilisin family serine protease